MACGNHSRGRGTALALLVAAAVAAGACGGSTNGGAEPESMRGQIVEVVPRGLLDLLNFSPSHLKGHMVQGLPVTVTFQREGDALVASGISD